MIVPNVRASFGRAEASFVIWLMTRGQEQERDRAEARLREEGFDAILDDPRTLNALLAHGGFSSAPEPLVFYVLVRHALLEGDLRDRVVADYLAALLINFGRGRRAYRIDNDEFPEYFYLLDLLEAAESATGHRQFLLRAHLGEYALWLSGLFADHIAHRMQRKGAPGLNYYEEMGATGFRAAADHREAERNGLDRVYRSCAERFTGLRIALNRISDRHLFPMRGDSVDRLLRQVSDSFNN
ncbi:MAG TPA: hypothetical protein VK864_03890 [Longimicrobiales bacterium]|nr:hypothetical protein [Longimicrobiales bacterium]